MPLPLAPQRHSRSQTPHWPRSQRRARRPDTFDLASQASRDSIDLLRLETECSRLRAHASSRASASVSEAPVWKCDLDKSQIVPTEHHPAIAKRTTSSERAGAGSSMVAAPSSHDLDDDAHLPPITSNLTSSSPMANDRRHVPLSHCTRRACSHGRLQRYCLRLRPDRKW